MYTYQTRHEELAIERAEVHLDRLVSIKQAYLDFLGILEVDRGSLEHAGKDDIDHFIICVEQALHALLGNDLRDVEKVLGDRSLPISKEYQDWNNANAIQVAAENNLKDRKARLGAVFPRIATNPATYASTGEAL